MGDWRDVEAHLRGVFREVNEQIARLGETFEIEGRRPLVCECGNAWCIKAIEIPIAEYEEVRGHGRRFVIAVDHENPDLEMIVSHSADYAITETFVGAASRVPEETNPRAEADLN